ncbi:hypothetical protein [Atopomonas hussainii]|uniref:hypothetical protein n=1 Tax=Atopomonas hussainii TaxID=1429083 RepID=UPI000944AE0E|nr:hypothetical protein [Atopomonas hussainii]
MKLIDEFHHLNEAQLLAAELEAKGVMCHVSGAYSAYHPRSSTGHYTYGVWVVFKSQYRDALEILNGRADSATNPLTVEQMNEIRKSTSMNMIRTFLPFLVPAALTALLIIGLAALVVYFDLRMGRT